MCFTFIGAALSEPSYFVGTVIEINVSSNDPLSISPTDERDKCLEGLFLFTVCGLLCKSLILVEYHDLKFFQKFSGVRP